MAVTGKRFNTVNWILKGKLICTKAHFHFDTISDSRGISLSFWSVNKPSGAYSLHWLVDDVLTFSFNRLSQGIKTWLKTVP